MKLLCMFLLDTLIIQIWSNSCLFYTEKAPKSQGFFVLFNFQPLEINKNDREQQIILQFVANGIVNSYVFWLLNQKTTDFDTLVKTDRELLHSCLCVLKKIN